MPVLERTTSALRELIDRLRPAAPEPAAGPSPTRSLGRNARWMLGLTRQPFRDNAAADELFVDDAVAMQLNMLAEQLRTGEMLPVLKGEAGSGKTSLLIQLMARAGEELHFFVVRGEPDLTAERVIVDMLRVLTRPVPEDRSECFRQLARQLHGLVADGRPAALAIDDAHAIPDRELGHLLAAHDSLKRALGGRFRLLLATDPAIELRLPHLQSAQVDAGQVFSANVRPLNRARIGPYLAHRLAMAGYEGPLPIDDDVLDAIASESGGLPRAVETAAAGEINARWPD
jgi:DamX protein